MRLGGCEMARWRIAIGLDGKAAVAGYRRGGQHGQRCELIQVQAGVDQFGVAHVRRVGQRDQQGLAVGQAGRCRAVHGVVGQIRGLGEGVDLVHFLPQASGKWRVGQVAGGLDVAQG